MALDGTEISGILGILGTGGTAEGLVNAASIPGCRVEVSDGFLDKGEISLLKLIDRVAPVESSTGDTLGDVSVPADVAAIIDGLIEFVCVLRCSCGLTLVGPGYRILGGRTGVSKRELSFGDQYNSPFPGPASG
jgi:hypothetical protein